MTDLSLCSLRFHGFQCSVHTLVEKLYTMLGNVFKVYKVINREQEYKNGYPLTIRLGALKVNKLNSSDAKFSRAQS